MRKTFRIMAVTLALAAFALVGAAIGSAGMASSMAADLGICPGGAVSFGAQPVYAAAKPALSAKGATMSPGTEMKLRVKNAKGKVVWKTSNSMVVRVIKLKGKFHQTAVLKAGPLTGDCVIRARSGGKVLKCRVTVAPDQEKDREIEIRDLSASSVDLTADIKAGQTEDPDSAAPQAEIFNDSAADFSVKLLQQTVKEEAAKAAKAGGAAGNTGSGTKEPANVLISPQSVMTALSMTENGAAGTTLKEMEKTLAGTDKTGAARLTGDQFDQYLGAMNTRLTGIDPGHVIYTAANSIWAKQGYVQVKDSFLQKNKTRHQAAFYEAPFDEQTVTDINNWVYNNTRNMIDKIIGELTDDNRMLLINTIAFEGKWEIPFGDHQVDKNGEFTAASGNKQKVTMLSERIGTDLKPYIQVAGGDGFVKHYKGSEIAFVGLLPPKGMSVDEYVASLSGQEFRKGWSERSNAFEVDLKLPQFKLDYDTSMKDTLQEMGIRIAFTDDADFSQMIVPTAETEAVKISDVLHKTHIEVDKDGTKAAAATAVIIDKAATAFPPKKPPVKEVYLDKPFVYALVDTQTGIPLFLGTMNSMADAAM